ncbi:MAG: hypothetical protein QOG60_1268 [Frankiaceae bacterium]|jgi:hypothetical protein|nr:hypothetical protein [Frankiaceae bacterium]
MVTRDVDQAGGSGNTSPVRNALLSRPVVWGVIWGFINAAAPVAVWWLPAATVLAMTIPLIAAVYIGFAVSDGRPKVIAIETCVAGAFFFLAAVAVNSVWLLPVLFIGHGVKDLWQHRTRFVQGTRWWPPFCATVDFVVAAVLFVEIAAGVQLHG